VGAMTRNAVARRIVLLLGIAGASITSLGLGVVLIGLWRFDRLVRRDVDGLLARGAPVREGMIVTEEMLEDLPEPVRRYLGYTGVVGKPFVSTVRLEQRGTMYLGMDQGWVALDADQHYTVEPPGFVWNATLHRGPLPIARGKDTYAGGEANMLIRAGSLFTVVDDKGPEMDQGSMMRYLSEMIWFPSAFLGENIAWEAVDDTAARVTLTDGDRSVTGTMYFDEEGRFRDFVAERYRTVEGGYDLETWSAPAYEYGELAGLRLPVRGGAVWKLPEGDLKYVDVTITKLQFGAVRRSPY
jgi:hypothetical protein